MNTWEKEVQQSLLDSEAAALKELEKQYAAALRDINEKVKQFQTDIDLLDQALSQDGLDDAAKALLQSQKQSKIYQKQYQQALKGQIGGIIDKMHSDHYTTIDQYLNGCYETSYIGTMYDIAKQGVPIIAPIDQAAAVRAVLTDSKIVEGFYTHLGVNYAKLKKTITQEVSRGIASGLSYKDIARNIHNVSGSGVSNAKRIARTEGHRIQQTAARDAQQTAKKRGADVVKQWDASLDKRTRDSHARVDGEIREIDEEFSNGLMFPGDPSGSAAEVINCRCTSNTRARWALDEDELNTLKDRAEYFGLDKTESFEDFSKKYLKAVENSENGDRIRLNKSAVTAFNSTADPLADVFGPGVISHPQEIESFKQELKRAGVNLIERKYEALAYIPALHEGPPGEIYISEGASFGAWSHEVQHFRNDRDAGWLGMRVIADPDKRYAWEVQAYNIEIEMALEAGRPDIADKLRANLEEERKKIYGE